LLLGTENGNIKVWNIEEQRLEIEIAGGAGSIQCLALSPNNKFLLFGTKNNCIKVLNWTEKTEHFIYIAHTNWVKSIVVSKDSEYFFSASFDKTIRFFNILDKKEEFSFNKTDSFPFALHLSRDSTILYSAGSDNFLRKMVIGVKNNVKTLQGHSGCVLSLALSSDSQYIISGSQDKSIKIWSLDSALELLTLEGHTDAVFSVDITQNMEYIVSGSADRSVNVWDFKSGLLLASMKCHSGPVFTVSTESRSKFAASGSMDFTIGLFELRSKEKIAQLKAHTDTVYAVKFSSDSSKLFSAAADLCICIWDVEKRILCGRVESVEGIPESICLTSDSKKIAVGDRNCSAYLWNIDEKKIEKKFKQQSQAVKAVSLSNDELLLAAGSLDWTINIYNLIENRREMTLNGHNGSVRSVVFSKDGKVLVSGSEDKSIKVWDLKDNRVLKVFNFGSIYDSFLFLCCICTERKPTSSVCANSISNLKLNLAHIYAAIGKEQQLLYALKYGADIYKDQLGNSPLFYALTRNHQDCVDVLLLYLNELGLPVSNNNFEVYCWALRDDLLQLLKNRSLHLPRFLNTLIKFNRQKSFPSVGTPIETLPMIKDFDTMEINPLYFIINKENDRKNQLQIKFKIFPFAIDVILGSEGSLQLLNTICSHSNDNIIQTSFVQFILQTRWRSFWWITLILAIVNWAQCGLMIELIVYGSNYHTIEFLCFVILNGILFLFDLYHAVFGLVKEYINLEDLANVFRAFSVLTWMLMLYYFGETDYYYITYIMCVFNFYKGLDGFFAFPGIDFYVRLVKFCVIRVVPYIVILLYLTLLFGMLNYTSTVEGRNNGLFYVIWRDPMQLQLGIFNNSTEPDLSFLYYMLCTVINAIILGNLIISILNDKLDYFWKAYFIENLKRKIIMVREIEYLMFWRRGINKKRYMHVCQERKIKKKWKGRLDHISQMLRNYSKYENTSINKIQITLDNLEKKLTSKSNNLS
jgi:WD40 repeat protein